MRSGGSAEGIERERRKERVASGHRVQGVDQVVQVFFLVDEPTGTDLDAALAERLCGLRSEYQHLAAQSQGLDPRDHGQAIEFGNADVENHHVRFVLPDQLDGIHAIVRLGHHLQTMLFQQDAHGEADDGVVVDDQDGMHKFDLP